jgi:CHAD domain-containing protein
MSARTLTFADGGRPVGDVRRALDAAGFELGPTRPERRTLLDTFDGRMASAGLRLEHRDDQVLVLSDRRSTVQLAAAKRPQFATELAGGPFRSRVAAATEVRALLPLRQLTARATPVRGRNGDDKVVAAATIYERLTDEGRPLAAHWVVEVDALTGYDKAATRLVAVLDGMGLRSRDGDVFDLTGPVDGPGRHLSSPTIALDPKAPAAEGFRAVLAHLAEAIKLNVPGTIDNVDPEFLHDLRVAVRRTRSVLSNAGRVLPADVRTRARESFGWLGASTGDARDLDVYELEWSDYTRQLPQDALEPVRAHLAALRHEAHEQLADLLRSEQTAELLAWWSGWLSAGSNDDDLPDRAVAPMREVVEARIVAAQRQLLTAGRAITASTPAPLVHELRKDAKRLRYLLECFGGLYAPTARKAFVSRLKALQDNLGMHQDADVHVTHLRRIVAELADSLPVDSFLAAGQLVEQLEQRRAATRAEFAARFADYDSKATRRALRELLATTAERKTAIGTA